MSTETLRTESQRTVRRPIGKVRITWTDPLLDTSLDTEVSEENRAAHTVQVADLVNGVPRKWFHTNHTTVLLDGTFYPMPATLLEARESQVGWWGTQNSDGVTGFFPPENRPTISVDFNRRYIDRVVVTGDSAYGEYPVDFNITAYTTTGGEYVALDRIEVTGNTEVSRTLLFTTAFSTATRITLEVVRWSLGATVVKMAEFYSSVVEVLEGDDILLMSTLKEFEGTEGTLPVGNISCNELDLSLQNITDRYFVQNTSSDIYTLVKRNRKIEPFVGFQYENGTEEYVPLGLYWSGDWATSENGTAAQTNARDRFELMRTKDFPYTEVFPDVLFNVFMGDLLEAVLISANEYMYDFYYDISDVTRGWRVAYFDPEFFKDMSYFDVIKKISEALLLYSYMDTPTDAEVTANGPLIKDIFRAKRLETVYPEGVSLDEVVDISRDDYIERFQVADTDSMANTILVERTEFSENEDGEYEGGEITYTRRDDDSIKEFGVLQYEYSGNELLQDERYSDEIATTLLKYFTVPNAVVEAQTFGDPTLVLADYVRIPEYQKNGIDKRGIFSLSRIETLYDGALRIAISGRKVSDGSVIAEAESRGVAAQPSIVGLDGVPVFPSLRGDMGGQDLSGYTVEPATIGREADTYEVPDSANVAPVFTVQPVDQTVTAGGTATFGPVSVTGAPTPTLLWQKSEAVSSYFEGGTTAHPFVASEWAASGGVVTVNPESVELEGTTTTRVSNNNTVHAGTVEYVEVDLTRIDGDTVELYMVWDGTTSNRALFRHRVGSAASDELSLRVGDNGTQRRHDFVPHGTTVALYDEYKGSIEVDGNDLIATLLCYRSGVLTDTYTTTVTNWFNTTAQYVPYMDSYSYYGAHTVYYDRVRIEGAGWPNDIYGPFFGLVGETSDTLVRENIGTTGDNFGDLYRCFAENVAGQAFSNEVEAIGV